MQRLRAPCHAFRGLALLRLNNASIHGVLTPSFSHIHISVGKARYHHYHRLGKGQIRLLEVKERFRGAPDFSIGHYPLGKTPPYTAVSYTWGDEPPTQQIRLDGTLTSVRPNLLDCLEQLSRKAEWQHIWVDALCINQEDVHERNEQVRIMDQIFRRATTVTAWLGRAAKPDDGSDWSAADNFYELARRPYWRRMWIVQELLLARDVQLAVGEHSFDFEHFKTLVSSAYKNSYHRAQIEGWLSTVPFLRTRDPDRFPFHRQPLLNLLVNYRHSQCTDPRDKVFSLLNLIPDSELKELSRFFPNYALTTDEVFAITLAFLRHSGQSKSISDYRGALTAFGAYTATARFRLEKASESYDKEFASQLPPSTLTFIATEGGTKSDSTVPRNLKSELELRSKLAIGSVHKILSFLASHDWQGKPSHIFLVCNVFAILVYATWQYAIA